MAKKTFVLDTNILLADPNAIFSFQDNEIILPFVVLEELDRHKSNQGEIGLNAREVSRQLHDLLKVAERQTMKRGISLPNGGKLKVVSSSGFISELNEELGVDKADNHILAVCLGVKKSILVTNDMLLRVKADAYGIPNQDYRKNAVADSIEHMYSGVTELFVSKETLGDLWNKQRDRQFLTEFVDNKLKDLQPNEFVHIKNGGSNKPFLVRKQEKAVRFVPEEYELPKVKPRNLEQRLALDLLMDESINLVTIVGKAGTGKTLLALAAGLEQVVEKKKYKSLLVCRPVQPLGKDIGFLPGSKEEKMEPWIAPIKDNLRFLLTSDGRKSKNSEVSLNYYFDRGLIEVEAMTYIRGRSIADAYMIIDEAQNLSAHELKTIITRVGEGTKIVLTGDVEQIDNMYVDSVSNGLAVAVERFKEHSIAGHITLKKGERSSLATLGSRIL